LLCDCRLSWLSKWLRLHPTLGLFTRCAAPNNLRGRQLAELQQSSFVCNDGMARIVSAADECSCHWGDGSLPRGPSVWPAEGRGWNWKPKPRTWPSMQYNMNLYSAIVEPLMRPVSQGVVNATAKHKDGFEHDATHASQPTCLRDLTQAPCVLCVSCFRLETAGFAIGR